jgi:hypothetical protein
MRLLLAGGRHLDDVEVIRRALDRAHAMGPAEVLIHGGAGVLGVAAEDWAREHRLHVIRYPANWREFGKRAEAMRNAFMLADSRADLVLALPGGGDTRDLVLRALASGLPVIDADGRPLAGPGAADDARRDPSPHDRWTGRDLRVVPGL